MAHKRKEIRNEFKNVLELEFTTIPVESNRTHRVSAFPLINIMNSADEGQIEDYTHETEPRRLTLKLDIYVASSNHDDDIDDILERIENVIRLNRKNQFWSYCFFDRAEDPESVPGETNYTIAPMNITFMYEVEN